jgi:hypothetical protein
MAKEFSIRLRMTPADAHEVRQIALTEGRSQADVMTRLIRDGFRYRRGEVSAIGQIAAVIRGEASGFAP